jgi:hypothetical protein
LEPTLETTENETEKDIMHSSRMLRLSAIPTALLLLTGVARGQAPVMPDTTLETPDGEPLDLSTPQPEETSKQKVVNPFASVPSGSVWNSKAGIDYSKPSFPAAEFQPGNLAGGSISDQSNGVGWATVTAPGVDAPLGWDQTSIETRVDPSQQQSKLGTTLSRSVPVGENVTATLQNGLAVTNPLPNSPTHDHGWSSSQALRFNVLPTDTSVSLGASRSSTDDKWLPSLSAEQKLFGGPFSVTGSVSETTAGEASKSLTAGFKRQW